MNLDEQLREVELKINFHLNRIEMHEETLKKLQKERKQISKQMMKKLEGENNS